jgi:hypothetical protein
VKGSTSLCPGGIVGVSVFEAAGTAVSAAAAGTSAPPVFTAAALLVSSP